MLHEHGPHAGAEELMIVDDEDPDRALIMIRRLVLHARLGWSDLQVLGFARKRITDPVRSGRKMSGQRAQRRELAVDLASPAAERSRTPDALVALGGVVEGHAGEPPPELGSLSLQSKDHRARVRVEIVD